MSGAASGEQRIRDADGGSDEIRHISLFVVVVVVVGMKLCRQFPLIPRFLISFSFEFVFSLFSSSWNG